MGLLLRVAGVILLAVLVVGALTQPDMTAETLRDAGGVAAWCAERLGIWLHHVAETLPKK